MRKSQLASKQGLPPGAGIAPPAALQAVREFMPGHDAVAVQSNNQDATLANAIDNMPGRQMSREDRMDRRAEGVRQDAAHLRRETNTGATHRRSRYKGRTAEYGTAAERFARRAAQNQSTLDTHQAFYEGGEVEEVEQGSVDMVPFVSGEVTAEQQQNLQDEAASLNISAADRFASRVKSKDSLGSRRRRNRDALRAEMEADGLLEPEASSGESSSESNSEIAGQELKAIPSLL